MKKDLQLDSFVEQEEVKIQQTTHTSHKYKIPGRTESPAVNVGMLKSWIREFCEWNNIKLPKYFRKKSYFQLIGMYRGMLDNYNINESRDILPQRPERHY